MLLVLASRQGANPWTVAHPHYFDYASIWDGRWYNIVQVAGYPATLPTAAGHVTENAWAFLPGYPSSVGAVMFLTDLPWPVAAVFVSLAFGLGSALLFYRMLLPRLGGSAALFAVVLLCVAPVSPLFQLAYAESMYLFLLMLALTLILRRRYWLLLPVVAVMGFVRPSGLALALALGLHVVYRWVRSSDAFPARERVASVVAVIVAGLAGLAWPAIAGVVTAAGRPTPTPSWRGVPRTSGMASWCRSPRGSRAPPGGRTPCWGCPRGSATSRWPPSWCCSPSSCSFPACAGWAST